MNHASLVRHVPLAALAAALALAPRTAAAQMPPPDFPPLPLLPGGTVAPTPVAPGAAPTAPGTPITPPTAAPLPPGYGYPYPYPYPYPAPPPRAEVDSSGLPPLPPRRRYDNGLFAGGVVSVVGGITAVFIGAYLVSSASDRIEIYCDVPSIPCAHKDDAPRMVTGAVMMALGAAVSAAGLPMWFIGSRYVTLTAEERKKAARAPDLRIGAGSVSLSLRF